MALKNSKVIMAKNIRLEKDYANVLSYNTSSMVALCTANAVQTFNHCTFLRHGENSIRLEMTYDNALKCNYVAFQNPDYSNKWFFAFIDSVEYINDGDTKINYTIDEFSTWWDYWQPEPCFIEREHATTDNPGDNLVPEQLELGDFVANGSDVYPGMGAGNIWYCIISIYSPKNERILATNCCGIAISGGLYLFPYWQTMQNAILQYATIQHTDDITQVFAIPGALAALMLDDCTAKTWGQGIEEDTFYQFNGKTSPYTRSVSLNPPTSLNGYTPVNKKLLSSPFVCCVLANTAGTSNVLAYEYFTNRTATVTSKGVPSIGCSIFSYPTNYKNVTNNFIEGIANGKFPTLSWSGDYYTNWLTQNSVNVGTGVIGDLATIGVGVGMGLLGMPSGYGLALGGGANIFDRLGKQNPNTVTPYSSVGNVNNGDVFTAMGENNCYLRPMSIRADQAERIDQFFNRYGYATNKLKTANQLGRQNWNYVKIGSSEEIGTSTSNDYFSVPAASMEIINNIYRKGVTIWHNHANIGNYSLTNPIVS